MIYTFTPQAKNGHIDIANEIAEALMKNISAIIFVNVQGYYGKTIR